MDPQFYLGVLAGCITSLLVSGVAAVVTIKAITTELRFHKEHLDALAKRLDRLPCLQPSPCGHN